MLQSSGGGIVKNQLTAASAINATYGMHSSSSLSM